MTEFFSGRKQGSEGWRLVGFVVQCFGLRQYVVVNVSVRVPSHTSTLASVILLFWSNQINPEDAMKAWWPREDL